MIRIALASTSPIKKQAVYDFFSKLHSNITIDTFDCSDLQLPPQPYNCTNKCALERHNYIKSKFDTSKYNYLVAIENGIEQNDFISYDCCVSVIQHGGIISTNKACINIDNMIELPELLTNEVIEFNSDIKGFKITLGQILYNKKGLDPNNWMKDTHKYDRKQQISDSLKYTYHNLLKELSKVSFL